MPAEVLEQPKRKVGRPKKNVEQLANSSVAGKVSKTKKNKSTAKSRKLSSNNINRKKEKALNDEIKKESGKLETEEMDLLKTLGRTLKKLTNNDGQ